MQNTSTTKQQTFIRLDFSRGTGKLLAAAALIVILLSVLFSLPGPVTINPGLFGVFCAATIATAALGSLLLRLASKPLHELPARAAAGYAFTILILATVAIFLAAGFAAHRLLLLEGLSTESIFIYIVRVLLVGSLCYAIVLRMLYLRGRENAARLASRNANLQALQSRIRPHFMFNSMNSIAGLIRNKPEDAEHALVDLADLIRVQMADARNLVPLSAEIETCQQYLAIEKLRLGSRLEVRWNIEEMPKGCQIPSLTLQPLLENAVYHGIEPNFGGGVIDIHFHHENNYVYVIIRNPVPEIGDAPHRKGNKIAMQNISERLSRHFGKQAYLTAETRAGIYRTKLRIPVVTA
jgi:two-component system sensor histidine kinase AlgZ